MDLFEPLHVGQYPLANNPFRKDVHATCDQERSELLDVQVLASLLALGMFHEPGKPGRYFGEVLQLRNLH